MNNPFDYVPDPACDEAFHALLSRIEQLQESSEPADVNFCRELEAGKMLGVMIAEDSGGNRHTLYSFSGQIGDGGFHYPGFVDPVFDYQQPDGHFKTKEADISRQTLEIAAFEKKELAEAKRAYEATEKSLKSDIEDYKEVCRRSKAERDSRRKSGKADEAELAAMIRQSQFEKAELRRRKQKAAAELAPFAIRLKNAETHLQSLKEHRRSDSEKLQQWLFDNFKLLDAEGESTSLSGIFASAPLKIPPSGAGECCAPKLLQAAYLQGLRPLAMAEYWYGRPKEGEIRRHGEHYPACRGKCLPILRHMLRGLSIYPPIEEETFLHQLSPAELEIIFENEWFCVVEKPPGMLSVPGKGASVSVEEWLAGHYGAGRFVKMAHRLDQDTSGLLIAAFGEESLKTIRGLFAMRKIHKTYVAELEGDYESRGLRPHGRISLPLTPDWLDRPRQKIDHNEGKEALTDYEFLGTTEGKSKIIFHPLTGRTHQLRVHAAATEGLGMPIVGDRLYGHRPDKYSGRMHLHARRIEFDFPLDGRHYCFESPETF